MPESDLEVTDMLSRATERVGLEWRKPPCPEPSRLDDWFLGVACAGSLVLVPLSRTCMRSLQVVDGTFYCQKRPANSSSLTTLGGAARGYGGPPGGAVSCDACGLILSPPGRANRASSSGPVGPLRGPSGEPASAAPGGGRPSPSFACPVRALTCYVDRTRSLRTSDQLLSVTEADRKGMPSPSRGWPTG